MLQGIFVQQELKQGQDKDAIIIVMADNRILGDNHLLEAIIDMQQRSLLLL
jgi:hypothetical protein